MALITVGLRLLSAKIKADGVCFSPGHIIILLVWHLLHVVPKRQRVEHDLRLAVPAHGPAEADEAMRCEAICSHEASLSAAD